MKLGASGLKILVCVLAYSHLILDEFWETLNLKLCNSRTYNYSTWTTISSSRGHQYETCMLKLFQIIAIYIYDSSHYPRSKY
ncbi:hypothetical protein JB92DRAFT_958100 [Gautieria morchelliformis]|nr:hypothetical protein JB92DRAFT_958100 [Gautieria morchelliformis]